MSSSVVTAERTTPIEMGLLATMATLSLWAFRSSYGGTHFFIVGFAFIILSAAVVLIAGRLELPAVVVVALLVLVYALAGGVAAIPDRAIGGIIPTTGSVFTALRMAITGWKDLITTAPPVGSTGDLLVIPILSATFAGGVPFLLIDRVGAAGRTRDQQARTFDWAGVAAAVPSMIVLGLAIATGVNNPVSIILHGGLFAAVVVAWLAWRERQRQPYLETHGRNHTRVRALSAAIALALAAAVGVAGYRHLPFMGDTTRDIWRQTVTPPFDPRIQPSPLSGYRHYVKAPGGPEGTDPVMFTVEGLPVGVPIRLATMDSFDGLVWQVSSGDTTNPSLHDSGSFERVGARLTPDAEGDLVRVAITIDQYSDVWIPDVGEIVEITFKGSAEGPGRDRELAKQFRYNRATDSAASRIVLKPGDHYEMLVRLPYLLEELAGQEIPRGITRLGPTVSGGEGTNRLATPNVYVINDDGERLDYMRNLLVNDGTYSDGDREAGQLRARAGHGTARLLEFAGRFPDTPLVGNAEQYASAYALLFRDLGVPTRVVMGFVPDAGSENSAVEVRATDVEAWVEVPVANMGWVAIFPTPPRDQTSVRASSPQQPEPDYRAQNLAPPPLTDPEFDQPATAAGDAVSPSTTLPEKQEADPELLPAITVPNWTGRAALISSPVLLMLAAALIVILLKRRRSRRRRRSGMPHERVANGWREVNDFAIDSGHPVPADMTRREAAAFVGGSTTQLAERADAVVWSGSSPDQVEVDVYWQDIKTALVGMRRQLSAYKRLRAALSVESFRASRERHKEMVDA